MHIQTLVRMGVELVSNIRLGGFGKAEPDVGVVEYVCSLCLYMCKHAGGTFSVRSQLFTPPAEVDKDVKSRHHAGKLLPCQRSVSPLGLSALWVLWVDVRVNETSQTTR